MAKLLKEGCWALAICERFECLEPVHRVVLLQKCAGTGFFYPFSEEFFAKAGTRSDGTVRLDSYCKRFRARKENAANEIRRLGKDAHGNAETVRKAVKRESIKPYQGLKEILYRYGDGNESLDALIERAYKNPNFDVDAAYAKMSS